MPSLSRAWILLGLFIASPTQAGFLSNYADWRKWEAYGQAMYVQGLFDSSQQDATIGEEPWVSSRRQGLSICFYEQGLTANMLADAITKHYQANVGDWTLPPAVVFTDVSRRICLSYINKERAKAGLPAWDQTEGAILSKMKK